MDLYIVGAGNVGGYIAYHAAQMGNHTVRGFLDDDISKHHQTCFGYPVLGNTDMLLQAKEGFDVIIAIASPMDKKKVVTQLKRNPHIHFPSLIHPSAWLGGKVSLQEGCIIYPGVCINYETIIGSFVLINMNVAIGHNSTINDFATLSPGVNCGGFTIVEETAFIGIGATIKNNITIGKGSKIGAGSTVIQDIPPLVTAVGNPAKVTAAHS